MVSRFKRFRVNSGMTVRRRKSQLCSRIQLLHSRFCKSYSLVWTMRFVRAKHLFLTAAAMLSLFVSAVSACACSHHEPVKKTVESSCHGPAHEAPAAEQPNPLSTHFGSDCNCLVRTPTPSIVAIKDDSRKVVETALDYGSLISAATTVQPHPYRETGPTFQHPQSNYRHALLASLPSRAPPSF